MISFYRRIRKGLFESGSARKYLLYSIGEIILVVIGILIALQVNNWNQRRIENKRFAFGIKELHEEIQSTLFMKSGVIDNLKFQLARMDSILNHPDEIPLQRVPPIVQLLDMPANRMETDYEAAFEFLQIGPSDENRHNLAKILRNYITSLKEEERIYASLGLTNSMTRYLRQFNIPVSNYYSGNSYEKFIGDFIGNIYQNKYDSRIRDLLQDESFKADLISIREVKKNMLSFVDLVNAGGSSFLQFIQSIEPNFDFGIQYMEVIGSATQYRNWVKGVPMQMLTADGMQWETVLQLVDGDIKFRVDPSWTLDWGCGAEDEQLLVFKGANIKVTEGLYLIRINLTDDTFKITPVDKPKE